MPDVTKQLCELPVNEDDPFSNNDPFAPPQDDLCDQETSERIIREKFLPYLYKIRNETKQIYAKDRFPEKWFNEDERVTRTVFAITLDLGILCPAFPAARLALNELANCETDPFKIGAMLSLLYYGYRHPKLEEINLYDAFESRILCEIPIQMLRLILPGLGDVLLKDERTLEMLKYWFEHPLKRDAYFNSEYKRTEFSILLASINVFGPRALEDCISFRAEWLRKDEPLYHEYRIRGLKAGAQLIGTNSDALSYYVQKIEKRELENEADVIDWLNTLRYLDTEHISSEQFTKLLTIGDALWNCHIPKYYSDAVEVLIKYVNYGNHKDVAREWLLSRLRHNDKEIVRVTLSSIDDLDPVDNSFKKQICHLLETEKDFVIEYSSNRIMQFSLGLVAKWKILEATPILKMLAADTKSEKQSKKEIAAIALKVLDLIKT